MITLVCLNPQCKAAQIVPDSRAGGTVSCKTCASPIAVPGRPTSGTQPAPRPRPVPPEPLPVWPAPKPPVGPPPRPAKTIAGHVLERELARSGMGVIYLAHHPLLDDRRAIKRPLLKGDTEQEMILARFRREVQAVGNLKHENVVRTHDAGADADGPYLVMEYVDGEPLSRVVDARGRLPVAEACEIIRQAALGLQAAHERGLVHRDIKPSNLMLARAPSPRVVVIDWGLVKRAAGSGASAEPGGEGLTVSQSIMGTADYIAPEQIRDVSLVDTRADVYSLGVTFYCLLAGAPPFHDRTYLHKLIGHQEDAFPPLTKVRRDVPKAVAAVLDRMVAKAPGGRFQTPGEVAAALAPFCGGARPVVPAPAAQGETRNAIWAERTHVGTGTTPSLPPVPPPATVRSPRRQPRGLLLACVVLAGVLVALLLSGHPRDAMPTPAGAGGPAARPRTVLDEDFKSTYERRLERSIPEGWQSDAFRVDKVNDGYALEVTKETGPHAVKLPPDAGVSGNFAVEGVYHLDAPHTLTVSLDNRVRSAALAVTFYHDGHVSFADDRRPALTAYKPGTPTPFLIKREGTKLRVFMMDKLHVADKNLDEALDYDTVRLTMTGGKYNYVARLFGLKITLLP